MRDDANGELTEVVHPSTTESTTTVSSTSYTTRTVAVTPSSSPKPSPPPPSSSKPSEVLPTPVVTVYPSPGTYTIPRTTITVTSETTVCAATSTSVTPGTHTYGGVTTVVETATTIVCPVATVSPSGSTSTSIITTTTHVCPSGGTYTIGPSTTTVDKPTVVVYPTPATYTPGTYTQPEHTVTAVETDYVYVCPTAPAQSSSPPPPPPSSSSPPPPPAPSSTQKESPAPSPSKSASPGGGGGGGNRYGVTYSPYKDDDKCKDADEVMKDIGKIKTGGFESVRIYAPDCNALKTVGEACKEKGLKMIIGVFNDDAENQIKQIADWKKWDQVSLIVVGNEAIHSQKLGIEKLAALIADAKKKFKAAGYTGQVTTAEPVNVWQENSEQLCKVCDIVGGNIHPFFNSKVSPKDAGKFISGQIDILHKLCDKDVVNLETGWPSGGDPNGLAIPGVLNQATALTSILTTKGVGAKSVILGYENSGWKPPGDFNVEQHWGCFPSIVSGALSSSLKAVGDVADKVGDAVDDL